MTNFLMEKAGKRGLLKFSPIFKDNIHSDNQDDPASLNYTLLSTIIMTFMQLYSSEMLEFIAKNYPPVQKKQYDPKADDY